ncbi:hypothetical protein C2E23DRAFT_872456 [Lenzites betulinus]|nr:hypothetical protein C2E23DRAFT_872456 [Lenzites betulinus]
MHIDINWLGLDNDTVRAIAAMRGEEPPPLAEHDPHDIFDPSHSNTIDNDEGDWEDMEDGVEVDDELVQEFIQFSKSYRKAKDGRTWRQRTERLAAHWALLLPSLVEGYLAWRHPSPPAPLKSSIDNEYDLEMKVYDIYKLVPTVTVSLATATTAAEALILEGYLVVSPVKPSYAVSLQTLELLRCIRLFKPSFSIEAFAKLVCHYYCTPYRRQVRNALSDAFDIYLGILREVDKRVRSVLGHDTPNWHVCNACPACCYKLAGEPELTFSRMYCMDGNNSLKRMRPLGGRQVGDTRVFEDSDYFLPQAFVNTFANEVSRRPHEDLPDGMEGDPTDGGRGVESSCTKNWKAAQADEKKRAWDVFEETGVFASACRHGLILWVIDMIRSGELARYPLATIAKVLDVLEERTLGGYDVGCSLIGTIERSSLGRRFTERQSRLCVNAFHGYSHEYSCQVRHHPTYIEGTGLEDLETMERIFSASNHLAPIIRYATAYRRRVFIDLFYKQWDSEKYINLAKMLYENYRQALSTIKELEPVVSGAMAALDLTREDLERFTAEEQVYLNTLGKETNEDIHQIAYVEKLQELRSVVTQLAKTNRQFLAAETPQVTFLPPHSGPTDYDAELSKTRKIETARRYLNERRKTLVFEVADLEIHLSIKTTWQPSDPEYIRVAGYITTRRYQRALANLQRLVVQRLFELHKMNLARTGYRMRRNIAKNMQTRSRAIRNAIATYNAAAAALDPPRPKLEWDSISHYQLLEEFDLLSETRADIWEKQWAQPAVRETLRLARRLARAREEITQVHVEAHRVHTHIRDENAKFMVVLQELSDGNSRIRANAHLLAQLKKLYKLPGFSGDLTPGKRIGMPPSDSLTDNAQRAHTVTEEDGWEDEVDNDNEDDAEEFEDEDVQGQVTALTDFVGGLASSSHSD